MTSNINPNNIDGAYPVAGQDNNSQGFRDNFTNTSTNFQYAADEITDLQAKAVLKAALIGETLDNDMAGSVLSNAQLQDMSETTVPLGTVSGSVTINYESGSFQTLTTNGSVSLAFTNFPAAGAAGSVTVQVTVASVAHTLTLPAAVSVNAQGIQGFNTSTGVITFASVGTYSFTFTTSNGGTTITAVEANKRLQPFNNSSEDLSASGAANLALSTSYFSTAAAETATLAAGVNGQIKTFAMFADTGDMVITVTNAGWKTSGTGTITFDTIGNACTLQYINGKWFCIGNNGCVFA
jgi:DUF4097 and DUF4098 domain-containing protein YvlB